MFILVLSTYSIKDDFKFRTIINIEELVIENNVHVQEKKIKEKLSFLFETNLFFLKRKDLEKKIKRYWYYWEFWDKKSISKKKLKLRYMKKNL